MAKTSPCVNLSAKYPRDNTVTVTYSITLYGSHKFASIQQIFATSGSFRARFVNKNIGLAVVFRSQMDSMETHQRYLQLN